MEIDRVAVTRVGGEGGVFGQALSGQGEGEKRFERTGATGELAEKLGCPSLLQEGSAMVFRGFIESSRPSD